ncbi:MAG: phosphoribosylformylglycinamidine cyclo-ligase [Eubacteriales bacterium]
MGKYTYKDAGVDIEAGYESVERIKKHVKKTFNSHVISHLGGFGGMFQLPSGYSNPVLISGTDGVGTKLMVAQQMEQHETIGIDCVAMCVNDILCQGAKPLFFLDYIACGKNEPKKIEEIVKGVVRGCIESQAALIGGETAEMPDMYQEDEYDIAGFAVGIVDKDKVITGSQIKKGDILLGLPSTGIHSNGFSLVRKLFFEKNKFKLDQFIPEFGSSLGEVLLIPTKIYYESVYPLIQKFNIKGLCHVTGGGFYENVPRIIPEGLQACVYKGRIPRQAIFDYIQKLGALEDEDMYSTFNMGIGLIMVVAPEEIEEVLNNLKEKNINPVILGEIFDGVGGIKLCP